MDILNKIEVILNERKAGYSPGWAKKGGGGETTVYWELCDSEGEDCVEVEIDIPWYYAPEEPDVGFRGGLEIDGDEKFAAPATFMGKKYRRGQDFPKALRKNLYDYEMYLKRSAGRDKNWEAWLQYEVERADRRF